MHVVVAAGEAEWESEAVREIESSAVLTLVRRCVDVADLLAVASTLRGGAALVSGSLPGLDAEAVRRVESDGLHVASVGSDLASARAKGIEHQAVLGRLDDLALRQPRSAPEPAAEHQAPLIAVWGPYGAPGRSTVTLAVASAFAARGVDTVMVDGDTLGGSLGQMVAALDDVSGLMAACRDANQGRVGAISSHLLAIDDRLRLLTGIQRADMWTHVRAAALSQVLAELRLQSEVVVVDCSPGIEPAARSGPGRDDASRQVLEEANQIVVVGRADPVGLARLVRAMHDLREVSPSCDPLLLLNMVRSSLGWNEREVVTTVGRLTGVLPAACLPYDRAGLDLALLSGRTPRVAAPASPFVSRIEALAATLMPRRRHASDLSPSRA